MARLGGQISKNKRQCRDALTKDETIRRGQNRYFYNTKCPSISPQHFLPRLTTRPHSMTTTHITDNVSIQKLNVAECRRRRSQRIQCTSTTSLLVMPTMMMALHALPLLMVASFQYQGFTGVHRMRCCHRRFGGLGCTSLAHPSSRLARDHTSSVLMSSYTDGYTDEVVQTLKRYGFGSRVVSLTNYALSTNPIPSEIYEGGDWNLCLIVGLKPPSSKTSDDGNMKPPLLDVILMDDDGSLQERKVVDIGECLPR